MKVPRGLKRLKQRYIIATLSNGNTGLLVSRLSFGAMTLGSVLWGKAAELIGLPFAHFVAAAGLLDVAPVQLATR